MVSNNQELKNELLKEAHSTNLFIHPGYLKMYKDLITHFWWPGMKKVIKEFVKKCQIFQQVKVEHQRPLGEFQGLPIPETKWGSITYGFFYFVAPYQTKT